MKSAVNNLEIYREAMEIGEAIWEMVLAWDFFAKDTVGKQMVRSADSVAANLAEGYGRYHFKENQKFCYYSRGSAEETQTWLEKAARRELVHRELARTSTAAWKISKNASTPTSELLVYLMLLPAD